VLENLGTLPFGRAARAPPASVEAPVSGPEPHPPFIDFSGDAPVGDSLREAERAEEHAAWASLIRLTGGAGG